MVELSIKSDAKNGQQYQKWLFAVSEINKIGIGFISIFLLKAWVSYLTISKRKNLSLPLKDETDQFVTCLVLPECLSVKIAFHPRTVKRIVMAPMPSLLFRCFSLFLPHLRTLAREKRKWCHLTVMQSLLALSQESSGPSSKSFSSTIKRLSPQWGIAFPATQIFKFFAVYLKTAIYSVCTWTS